MSHQDYYFDASRSLTALEQDGTIIAVIEMSQSKWLVAALVPGVERHPLKKFDAQEEGLLKLLHRWRNEAGQAGREIKRIVVAYEVGRDGFWLARWLRARDGGQKCAACEAEETKQEPPVKLSRKDSDGAAAIDGTAAPPIVQEVLRSPGQPLATQDLVFFGPRFGFDLSRVRIHTGHTAAESAQSVNALAYASGANIAFARPEGSAPKTPCGARASPIRRHIYDAPRHGSCSN